MTLIDPDLPLANARFQASNCTVLLNGRFGHMLKLARTRRLPCGDRIAQRTVGNYRGTQQSS